MSSAAEVISVDAETGLIQGGCLAPPLACVTACNDVSTRGEIWHWQDPECERFVEDVLAGAHFTTANGAYDLAVFMSQWPRLTPLVFQALMDGRVHDVLIRQKLMDIADGCYRFEGDRGARRHDSKELPLQPLGAQQPLLRRAPRKGQAPAHLRQAATAAARAVGPGRRLLRPGRRGLDVQGPPHPGRTQAQVREVHRRSYSRTRPPRSTPRTPSTWSLAGACAPTRSGWRRCSRKSSRSRLRARTTSSKAGLVREWDESRAKNGAVKRMRDLMGDKCELTKTRACSATATGGRR